MSEYLAGADLALYGVPTATPAQIQQASNLVDAYCDRPEGLAFSLDFQKRPCFMSGLTPSIGFTLPGSISPGQNIVITPADGFISEDLLGEVLIADRATPSATEAVVVSAVNPQAGTFTLQIVGASHDAGTILEAGLVLAEERPLPSKRSITRVSKFPLVRLLSGMGRYAYGRRSDQVAGLYNDTNLLAALQTFGGPPAWVPFDITQASISASTGEVWVPAGLLLAYYSDVKLRYVAGYPVTALPSKIKQATAALASALAEYPDISGNVKKIQAGGTSIERFANTLLDDDTKGLLEPYRAKLLF